MSNRRRHASIPEQLRGLARKAVKQKWTITMTGNGHLRWTSPTGEFVLTASTPSTHRQKTNATILLRKAGLRLDRSSDISTVYPRSNRREALR